MVTQSAGHEYPQQAFNLGPGGIKTGAYTGDGGTSHAITGVGFRPKMVWVFNGATAAGDVWIGFTTNTLVDNNASGLAFAQLPGGASWKSIVNGIISLDADGFTVDDAGTDAEPNQTGVAYEYVAIA